MATAAVWTAVDMNSQRHLMTTLVDWLRSVFQPPDCPFMQRAMEVTLAFMEGDPVGGDRLAPALFVIELIDEETLTAIPGLGVAPTSMLVRAVAAAKQRLDAGLPVLDPVPCDSESINRWLEVGVLVGGAVGWGSASHRGGVSVPPSRVHAAPPHPVVPALAPCRLRSCAGDNSPLF